MYDVSAIDPQNVWAVGEIERSEISGEDRYNAVKWNGNEYEYFKIFYFGGLPRIDVVLAFEEDDIWMFGQDRYSFWDSDSFITKNFNLNEINWFNQRCLGCFINGFLSGW